MLTKTQTEILNLFRKNPFLRISMLQIKKRLKKGSYQRVYEAVKELESNKILSSEKMGRANIISLSLTPQSISQLAFFDEQEAMSKKLPNYEKILSLKEISNYLIVLTGSYASGKQTKDSDFDLVLVIPNNQKAIDIQKTVENLTLSFHPQIHLYIFTNKDFIEMLLDEKENYGKEIFQNHIILKNAHIYYEILKEAVEHGFKG